MNAAAPKMMLTLAAMCLVMVVPAMGERTLLGALRDLRAPVTRRVHVTCVLRRV